jgi:DNA-binding NarL/FixJ family response regulator
MSIFEDLGYVRADGATDLQTLLQETGADPRQVRVLIVEDSVMFGKALVSLLENDDRITVVGRVESGEAAIGFPMLSELDVILVDLGLPGIDGIELTRRLVALSSRLRVIVLSGDGDQATKHRALAAGAAAILVKCGPDEELIDSVMNVGAP